MPQCCSVYHGAVAMGCKTESIQLDKTTVKAIETVLAKGERAEVVPVKNGVKVLIVRREEVKMKS